MGIGDGEREEPDLAVGKKNSVGDEDAEDCAGCSDSGHIQWPMSPEHGSHFYENGDKAGADSAQEEVVGETLFAPDKLQLAAKHPEHEHIDEQVPQAAMEEKIGKRLPDAHPGNRPERDKPEVKIDPCGGVRAAEHPGKRLHKENACTRENDVFDGGSNEAAPIEADSRRAERRTHISSVRRCEARSQKMKWPVCRESRRGYWAELGWKCRFETIP